MYYVIYVHYILCKDISLTIITAIFDLGFILYKISFAVLGSDL
jgi:hypothetical protein